MAGIPPLIGFFGKFYIFLVALNSQEYVVCIVGLFMSVLSATYYLRLIKIMNQNKLSSNYSYNNQIIYSYDYYSSYLYQYIKIVPLILSSILVLFFSLYTHQIYFFIHILSFYYSHFK